MQKSFYFLFSLLFSVASLQLMAQSNNFELELIAKDYNSVKISKYNLNSKQLDLLGEEKMSEGVLQKKYAMTESGIYILQFEDKSSIVLAVEPNEVIKVNKGETVVIKGSKGSLALQKGQEKDLELKEKYITSLETEYQKAAQEGDQKKMEEIVAKYEKVVPQIEKEQNQFLLDELGSSVAWVVFAESWNDNSNYEFMQKVSNRLKKENPKAAHTKYISQKVEQFGKTAIGATAPEIALADKDGKTIKLSSLKGKYVLIDFWASWCGPCRKENPNVVNAYNKFNAKGFEIYGVALDKDKEAWLKAIEKDGLTWANVSDLKDWNSEAAKEYNVKAIPMNFLLDKNGKIIAKNLRGKALEDKLAELLN